MKREVAAASRALLLAVDATVGDSDQNTRLLQLFASEDLRRIRCACGATSAVRCSGATPFPSSFPRPQFQSSQVAASHLEPELLDRPQAPPAPAGPRGRLTPPEGPLRPRRGSSEPSLRHSADVGRLLDQPSRARRARSRREEKIRLGKCRSAARSILSRELSASQGIGRAR